MKLRKDEHDASEEELKENWAVEMAEVCQGLGVTRLIFNTHRDEDGEIEQLLIEAQHLRQKAGLRASLAETFNALGSLKQKQKAYQDSEHYYEQSLKIRKTLPEGEDHGKAKQQSIAQSLTSLGNLCSAIADGEAKDDPERRKNLLEEALKHLQSAKEAYVKGFHEGHPKVAWALEGMGNTLEKVGDLKAAQKAFAEAIAIRRNLQLKDENKQMFSKELKQYEERVKTVGERRSLIKSRLNKLQGVALAVARQGSSSSGPAAE